MGLLDSVVKGFYKVADPVLTAIAHPFKVAEAVVSKEKTVKQVSEEFFAQSKAKQIAQTVISGINAELALLGGSAVATKGVGAITKAITLKNVGLGAGALAIEGAVAQKPLESVKVAQDTISGLPEFGGNVAEFVDNPSLAQAQKTFTDNPYITSSVLAGGAIVGGYGLSNLANIYATRQNTQALNESIKAGSQGYVQEFDYGDQKNLIQEQAQQERKNIEAQTQAQIQIAELQFKQQKELMALQTQAVAPSTEVVAPPVKKKKKRKKKAKPKKKAKKKTRRSKKKKKKSIKRRKK